MKPLSRRSFIIGSLLSTTLSLASSFTSGRSYASEFKLRTLIRYPKTALSIAHAPEQPFFHNPDVAVARLVTSLETKKKITETSLSELSKRIDQLNRLDFEQDRYHKIDQSLVSTTEVCLACLMRISDTQLARIHNDYADGPFRI